MAEIIVAADEVAATKLVHDAESMLMIPPQNGSGSLGPFTASYHASVAFANGSVDLIAPNIIRIVDLEIPFTVGFSFTLDLNNFLPQFCLPQICIHIPFDGTFCTPKLCIPWPTITIPVSHSDTAMATGDFSLNPNLVGGQWKVDIVVVGIPSLSFGAGTAAILAAIGLAAAAILAPIPFIGPFLAIAVAAVTAAIGLAGITGLLGLILTPFVSGLTFTVYQHSQVFEVLPVSSPIDPAVNITLDLITAAVVSTDEDELVISADISP